MAEYCLYCRGICGYPWVALMFFFGFSFTRSSRLEDPCVNCVRICRFPNIDTFFHNFFHPILYHLTNLISYILIWCPRIIPVLRVTALYQTHTHLRGKWCVGGAGDGTWVGETGVLSRCRFQASFSERTRDAWAMDGSASSSRTADKPLGGKKGRAKRLREFPVYILQVSWLDGPIARLIDAATAPGTQPARPLVRPPAPAIVGTPGASARIECTDASARNAATFVPWTPREVLLGQFRAE